MVEELFKVGVSKTEGRLWQCRYLTGSKKIKVEKSKLGLGLNDLWRGHKRKAIGGPDKKDIEMKGVLKDCGPLLSTRGGTTSSHMVLKRNF